MTTKYTWSTNPLKLQRAIGIVGESDEEAVKAKYVEIGGKVVPSTAEIPEEIIISREEATEQGIDIETVENEAEVSEDTAIIVPKKRGRKAKDAE